GLLSRLRAELEQPRRVLDERVRAEREALGERVRLLEERLRALERLLAEREGLPPAARALADQGPRLALSMLDVEPGMERAVAAPLRQRASALGAADAPPAAGLRTRAEARIPAAASTAAPGPAVRRPAELTQRLVATLDVDASRFEAPLRSRADVGGAKSGELAAELRRLGADEADLRRTQAD